MLSARTIAREGKRVEGGVSTLMGGSKKGASLYCGSEESSYTKEEVGLEVKVDEALQEMDS